MISLKDILLITKKFIEESACPIFNTIISLVIDIIQQNQSKKIRFKYIHLIITI